MGVELDPVALAEPRRPTASLPQTAGATDVMR